MKLLSIIIPVFNRSNITKTCLTDLGKLPHDEVQIIVSDDASTDNTRKIMLDLEFANICLVDKYVIRDKNGGFGQAVSSGFRRATGKYVLVLNNDIRVKSDHNSWHRKIIDFLDSVDDDYLVGPTGGLVDLNTGHFIYETNDPNKEINYMSGWCLAAKRETWNKLAYDEINMFDPSFYMYFEDTLLGIKAKKLGVKFRLIDLPLTHFGKLSSKQLNVPKLYNESRLKFLERVKEYV